MLYKGQPWTRFLPSDPEIIASVFSGLLDDSYLTTPERR